MRKSFVEISTSHLHVSTRSWMDEQAFRNAVPAKSAQGRGDYLIAGTGHGWFCVVPEELNSPVPSDLAEIFKWARNLSLEYILFDTDGQVYSELGAYGDAA